MLSVLLMMSPLFERGILPKSMMPSGCVVWACGKISSCCLVVHVCLLVYWGSWQSQKNKLPAFQSADKLFLRLSRCCRTFPFCARRVAGVTGDLPIRSPSRRSCGSSGRRCRKPRARRGMSSRSCFRSRHRDSLPHPGSHFQRNGDRRVHRIDALCFLWPRSSPWLCRFCCGCVGSALRQYSALWDCLSYRINRRAVYRFKVDMLSSLFRQCQVPNGNKTANRFTIRRHFRINIAGIPPA